MGRNNLYRYQNLWIYLAALFSAAWTWKIASNSSPGCYSDKRKNCQRDYKWQQTRQVLAFLFIPSKESLTSLFKYTETMSSSTPSSMSFVTYMERKGVCFLIVAMTMIRLVFESIDNISHSVIASRLSHFLILP